MAETDRAEAALVPPGPRGICRLRDRRRGGGGGRTRDPRRMVEFPGRIPVPPLGGLLRSGGHGDIRRGRDLRAAGRRWYRMAKAVLMIHDITTDTENPPEFVSILPLRKDASNPAEYGGPEIAAKQHAAYPDIRPLTVGISPSRGYEAALATARRMNWRIVDGNPSERRIEAVATTRWFGFRDDIVIRISPAPNGGSVLDIRSVSRVGLSDIGTNARRIRTFLKTFSVAAKAGS